MFPSPTTRRESQTGLQGTTAQQEYRERLIENDSEKQLILTAKELFSDVLDEIRNTSPQTVDGNPEAATFQEENGIVGIYLPRSKTPIVSFNTNISGVDHNGQMLPFGEITLSLTNRDKERLTATILPQHPRYEFITQKDGTTIESLENFPNTPEQMNTVFLALHQIMKNPDTLQANHPNISLNPERFNATRYLEWLSAKRRGDYSVNAFIYYLENDADLIGRRELLKLAGATGALISAAVVGGIIGRASVSNSAPPSTRPAENTPATVTEIGSNRTAERGAEVERQRLIDAGLSKHIPLYNRFKELELITGSDYPVLYGSSLGSVRIEEWSGILKAVADGRVDANAPEVIAIRDGWIETQELRYFPESEEIDALVDNMNFDTQSTKDTPEMVRDYVRLFSQHFPISAPLIGKGFKLLNLAEVAKHQRRGSYRFGSGVEEISSFSLNPTGAMEVLGHEALGHALNEDLQTVKKFSTFEAYAGVQETRLEQVYNLLDLFTNLTTEEFRNSGLIRMFHWYYPDLGTLNSSEKMEKEFNRLQHYLDPGITIDPTLPPEERLALIVHGIMSKTRAIAEKLDKHHLGIEEQEDLDYLIKSRHEQLGLRVFNFLMHKTDDASGLYTGSSTRHDNSAINEMKRAVDQAKMDFYSIHPPGSMTLEELGQVIVPQIEEIFARHKGQEKDIESLKQIQRWMEIKDARHLLETGFKQSIDLAVDLIAVPHPDQDLLILQVGDRGFSIDLPNNWDADSSVWETSEDVSDNSLTLKHSGTQTEIKIMHNGQGTFTYTATLDGETERIKTANLNEEKVSLCDIHPVLMREVSNGSSLVYAENCVWEIPTTSPFLNPLTLLTLSQGNLEYPGILPKWAGFIKRNDFTQSIPVRRVDLDNNLLANLSATTALGSDIHLSNHRGFELEVTPYLNPNNNEVISVNSLHDGTNAKLVCNYVLIDRARVRELFSQQVLLTLSKADGTVQIVPIASAKIIAE